MVTLAVNCDKATEQEISAYQVLINDSRSVDVSLKHWQFRDLSISKSDLLTPTFRYSS